MSIFHGTDVNPFKSSRHNERALVTVIVGPQGVKIQIPMQPLCEQSRFFAAALRQDTFKESKYKVVELPHLQASSVHMFCVWIECRVLVGSNLAGLAMLFDLADYVDVPELRMEILKTVREHCHRETWSLDSLVQTFENVSDTSVFGLYIIEKLQQGVYVHQFEPPSEFIAPESLSSEFMSTLLDGAMWHYHWTVRSIIKLTPADPVGNTSLWNRFDRESVEDVIQGYQEISREILRQSEEGGD